jgi:hypothetical protein
MTVDPSGRAVRPTPLLRGWVEREARVARETQPLRQALDQREHYTDLRGVNHPLSEMSAAEASLVLALLERHAVTLLRGELAEHLLELEENAWQPVAAVEAYRALTTTAAHEWLRQTPLHRALTERTGQ